MVNFIEYQKWEGSIAVPIADCYNLIVEESEKASPEDVSLDFTKYLYKIIDIKKLNGNDDVETLKSMIFDMQGKTFRELYNEEVNLIELSDALIRMITKYKLLERGE